MENKLYAQSEVSLERENGLLKQYPGIDYEHFEYQPSEYALIDDISEIGCNVEDEIACICEATGRKINSYTTQELTQAMACRLEKQLSDYLPEEVLLVFPGGGGIRTYNALPQETRNYYYNMLYLDVHRQKNDEGKREAKISEDDLSLINDYVAGNPNFRVIGIIDDAANTGGTAIKIKDGVEKTSDYDWFVATQLAFSPVGDKNPRVQPSGIEGVPRVITGLVLDGEEFSFPCAFLSSAMKWVISTNSKIQAIIDGLENEEAKMRVTQALNSMQQKYEEYCKSKN